MTLPIYQVDAFADQLFAGNPAAICPLKSWLPDTTLQAIAAENNLSETAFFVPNGQRYHLRWFTPAAEVDLCGHATLATAHVLWKELGEAHQLLRFDTRSGEVAVFSRDEMYWLDFPADEIEVATPPPGLAECLGATPLETWVGRDDYLVILESEATLSALQPDFQRMAKLGGRGLIATARGEEVDFVSRGFFPNVGINEDPVTGSAHTTLMPYWAKIFGKAMLTGRQISQRGGNLSCILKGDRVEIGGTAITYLRGEIDVPGGVG